MATHIKKGLIAEERRKVRIDRDRNEWIHHRQPIMREQPPRLVFLDETGTKTNMTRPRGRSLKGHRLFGYAPFRRQGNQTLIAGGLACDCLIAPWVIPGALNQDAFNTCIEHVLAPALEPGTVVIPDNLATHKSQKAADLLKANKGWFLFLPAYSPDMNPTFR